VKIYVAAVEALRKKERGGQNRSNETQFGTKKNAAFLSFTHSLKAKILVYKFFLFFVNLIRVWTKLRVLVAMFS
jgi:hypothetical protein